MSNMFEQFQFAVGSLSQNGGTKGLDDFLDSNCLTGQIVAGGAFGRRQQDSERACCRCSVPDKTKCSHANGLQFGVSGSDGQSWHEPRQCDERPRCYFKSSPEDLRTNELGHIELALLETERSWGSGIKCEVGDSWT